MILILVPIIIVVIVVTVVVVVEILLLVVIIIVIVFMIIVVVVVVGIVVLYFYDLHRRQCDSPIGFSHGSSLVDALEGMLKHRIGFAFIPATDYTATALVTYLWIINLTSWPMD
ncbi:hypothetical protein M0802_010552 [Mischocyttarus mexicanus]|nr:hypothetical protein M0802_010552 [Mischocyttarus mexicanus]